MATLIYCLQLRQISTATCHFGKHNFRKFLTPNKRGTRIEKQLRGKPGGGPIDHRGVRPIGYRDENDTFVIIPERVPEMIVPDLKDCEFKPYVSYRAPNVTQSEFTCQNLFNAVYAKKIIKDFQTGKLNENGEPLEPSEEEKLKSEEAWIKARQTGSDLI